MLTRANKIGHFPTLAYAHYHAAWFETTRLDAGRAKTHVETSAALAQEHGVSLWQLIAPVIHGWTVATLHDAQAGTDEMRRGIASSREQGVRSGSIWFLPLLALMQAKAGQIDQALETSTSALAELDGGHCWDAEAHRIRGEILLPANAAAAEEAFLTATAIAQQQKTRSCWKASRQRRNSLRSSRGSERGMRVGRAATRLIKPRQRQRRPQLEGANAARHARRNRRSEKRRCVAPATPKLQTSYGQALLWSKGFAADETKAAYTRARELAAGATDADERFPTYYGLWVGSLLRGELVLARETAETFLSDAKAEGRTTEAAVASRNLGQTCLYQGDVIEAQARYQEALRDYDPEHGRDYKVRFAQDHRAAAKALLALTSWVFGEIAAARDMIEGALEISIEAAHQPTQANVYFINALIETLRGDAAACKRCTEAFIELSRERGLALYSAFGALTSSWSRAQLGEREIGVIELRQALASYTEQGNRLYVPLFEGRLAELEAEADDAEGALNRIDQSLALASKTGEHWTDAFLHRIRGDILLKHEPANTAPAEEAFLTAIAIAQQQKARSFELQAALPLAKLYQSAGRARDAHDILAPVLKGFSSTPEFREIAEAQSLLGVLRENDEVKKATASQQFRLQLQNAYGQALMYAKGYTAPETSAALGRARELAEGSKSPTQQLSVNFGLWINQWMRGELAAATSNALAVLHSAKANQAADASRGAIAQDRDSRRGSGGTGSS
jgi:predicted ATPase